MIEKLLGAEKVSILQCAEIAKQIGFDSTTFDLCGPGGKVKARWLDAYLGILQLEGHEDFMMVDEQMSLLQTLWCENIKPMAPSQTSPG